MRHSNNYYVIYIFLLSILMAASCQNSHNEPVITLEQKSKKYDFNNFYLFKRNMTYDECGKLLKANNIYYKTINKTSDTLMITEGFSYDISNEFISKDSNIKIIEGSHLAIVDNFIPKFQLAFYKDTLLHFVYNHYIGNRSQPNNINATSVNKLASRFNENAQADMKLLETLSEGLKFKYGEPSIQFGSLNSLGKLWEIQSQLETDPLSIRDISKAGNFKTYNTIFNTVYQYDGHECWENIDSSVKISLSSLSDKAVPLAKRGIESTTMTINITVIFETKLQKELWAQEINQFEAKQKSDSQNEKMKKDSVDNHKKKLFQGL